MKKKVLIFIFICFTAKFVASHSGRTDSDGGHYNHKTGEYHHHGGKTGGGWIIGGIIVGGIILRNLLKGNNKK